MPIAETLPIWDPVPIPPQADATEGVVEIGGARIWYWDTGGDGAPVIFLHAGTQSGAGWLYQQPVFARAGYRAIGYSRRSYLGSHPGSADDPGYASDDLHRLINHLGLEKVHLVAVAHGGFFAIDYVLSHPGRVRSLSIISSLMGIEDADYKEAVERLRTPLFNDLPHDFKELGPSYRAANPEGVAVWNRLTHEAIPGKRVMQSIANRIDWKSLESIAVPTLLATGDADLYVPPALARMQAAHLKPAKFAIIPEAGHASNWEQPEAFNRLVMDFIAGNA